LPSLQHSAARCLTDLETLCQRFTLHGAGTIGELCAVQGMLG
jgi:hypothetical protein